MQDIDDGESRLRVGLPMLMNGRVRLPTSLTVNRKAWRRLLASPCFPLKGWGNDLTWLKQRGSETYFLRLLFVERTLWHPGDLHSTQWIPETCPTPRKSFNGKKCFKIFKSNESLLGKINKHFLKKRSRAGLTHILPCTLDECMYKKTCPKLETEYLLVCFGYNKGQMNCFHYRTSSWHLLFMLIASQPHFVNGSINMTSKSSRHFEGASLCFTCNMQLLYASYVALIYYEKHVNNDFSACVKFHATFDQFPILTSRTLHACMGERGDMNVCV